MREAIQHRTSARAVIGATAAAAVTVGMAPMACAHDAVIGGSPADGEVVSEFPNTLTLDFSGEPQDGFNTFAVSRVDSQDVLFNGEPTIDGNKVSLTVPDGFTPEPGEYTIGYQIISSDGHATKGKTTFTYEPAGQSQQPGQTDTAAQPAATTDTAAPDSSASFSPWLWLLLGVLIIAGVAAIAITRRGRTPGNPDQPTNPEN